MNYLNDIEKEALIGFNENQTLKNAVKKVLLEEIYYMGVLDKGEEATERNWAYSLGGEINNATLDDAKLGSLLKATVQGISAVERGFDKLSEFKRDEIIPNEETNPAE